MIPMIMLCFLAAGAFCCASIAASAAFLAQRGLAGTCDGAAVAAAGAVSRAGLGAPPAGTAPAGRRPASGPDTRPGAEVLPLDADAVGRAVADYQAGLRADGSPIRMTAATDGQAVTVTCRRTVRVPFGGLLGHPDGFDRTAIAHARSPLD